MGEAGAGDGDRGATIDENRILKDIKGPISEPFPRIREAIFKSDPAFARSISLSLAAAGFKTAEVLQNYQRLSEPSMVFESLIRASASDTTDTAFCAGTWRISRSNGMMRAESGVELRHNGGSCGVATGGE